MSDEAREILRELIAARNAGSGAHAARLLDDDARYWDCELEHVRGRAPVAAALTSENARVELETVAAGADDMVAELQIERGGAHYRSTEVYRLAGGRIVALRAYFDPAARA